MSTDAPQARRVIGQARRTGIPVVVPPPLRRAEGDAGSAATLPAASPPPLLARPSPRLGHWDGADADAADAGAADAAADGGADADEPAAVAARLDALQARMESHELIFQEIVAQTVMINDTVGALAGSPSCTTSPASHNGCRPRFSPRLSFSPLRLRSAIRPRAR